MSLLALSGSGAYPPTNPILCEALVIKGPYAYGPNPGAADNRLFMDELECLPWDQVMAALDAYQARGYTSITLGPAVARGYHGDYPDTDWLADPSSILRVMRECRRRGLRITMVVLPDCQPYYFNDGSMDAHWDWERVERDLTPFYSRSDVQSLVEGVQCEWEVLCPNVESVKAAAYCRRVFPKVADVWWHLTRGHSAPGLSSEHGISEGQMWQNVAAAGVTGAAWQDDSIYMDAPPEAQFQNFCYNVWDWLRHCAGYNAWPVIKCWTREYRAYAIYNWDAPESGSPEDWGTAAREIGSENIGDGGPRKA